MQVVDICSEFRRLVRGYLLVDMDDDLDPEDFRGLCRTERIEQSFNGLGLLKIYNSDFTKIERECRS